MNDIDSPAVKLEREVKLERKETPLDIKKLQTEELLNNKVEYLYSYDDPKNWKPCGKCSICQKALGQEDTLKTHFFAVHEGKKAQDQATKQGRQKLKAFKSSKKKRGGENNNSEAVNPETEKL